MIVYSSKSASSAVAELAECSTMLVTSTTQMTSSLAVSVESKTFNYSNHPQYAAPCLYARPGFHRRFYGTQGLVIRRHPGGTLHAWVVISRMRRGTDRATVHVAISVQCAVHITAGCTILVSATVRARDDALIARPTITARRLIDTRRDKLTSQLPPPAPLSTARVSSTACGGSISSATLVSCRTHKPNCWHWLLTLIAR